MRPDHLGDYRAPSDTRLHPDGVRGDFGHRHVLRWHVRATGATRDELWAASPLRHADGITTPTVVLHSEADWRCPIEQGEQLFALLQNNGVESEMLRFPGESHELTRGGKPTHRVERFEAVLEWHARYLL